MELYLDELVIIESLPSQFWELPGGQPSNAAVVAEAPESEPSIAG